MWEAPPQRKNKIVDFAGRRAAPLKEAETAELLQGNPAQAAVDATKNVRRLCIELKSLLIMRQFTLFWELPATGFGNPSDLCDDSFFHNPDVAISNRAAVVLEINRSGGVAGFRRRCRCRSISR